MDERTDFSSIGKPARDPDLGTPKVITLADNYHTQIIQSSSGEYFLRKTNPITKETFLISLDDIESPNDLKKRFKQGEELLQKQDFSQVTYPLYEWTKIETTGERPKGRNGHTMVIADNYLIVFGGCHKDIEYFNEMNYFDIRFLLLLKFQL